MKNLTVQSKRVLVLGLGLHGGAVAVVKWLSRHGARVTVSDLKSRTELAPSLRALRGWPITFRLGAQPSPKLLSRCDIIIQNPAVPRTLPFLKLARQRGVLIENEASLFLRLCPSPLVVGVTGSKGKSTTTALLGAIMKRWNNRTVVAGNIRDTVMFGVLDKVTAHTPVVLELSSWHLELVGEHKLRVPVAAVTNVTQEHLNRYSSFKSYAAAKAQIFKYQKKSDTVILNYDNAVTRQFARQAQSRVVWFSGSRAVPSGVGVAGKYYYWYYRGTRQRLFSAGAVGIPGEHNIANVAAAVATAYVVGVPSSTIHTAVKQFRGLKDRLELVRRWHGVDFYNDTTATAPAAVQAALRAFAGKSVYLIAGGTDKNLDYNEMARDIRQHAKLVIALPGTATVKLIKALGTYKRWQAAGTMVAAVRVAASSAKRGSVVLLSPGAASFGLFRHEFDRGQAFRRAVMALK